MLWMILIIEVVVARIVAVVVAAAAMQVAVAPAAVVVPIRPSGERHDDWRPALIHWMEVVTPMPIFVLEQWYVYSLFYLSGLDCSLSRLHSS